MKLMSETVGRCVVISKREGGSLGVRRALGLGGILPNMVSELEQICHIRDLLPGYCMPHYNQEM